ncbi:HAMP domain-containing protein [Trinickia terrae]|uniref:HAMP domain-containing protein n=2 Tax=Trinickia terrae TaxID=2571161 RepID=A0A4U1HEB9_9BURK|nr:HAMP domain-containing protein [Trinickia terrae]
MDRERARRYAVLEERATRIAELYSRSLAQPLWNVDRGAIDNQLAALAPNPEVVEFTVTAANYGVVSNIRKRVDAADQDNVVRVRPIEYDPPGAAPREKIGEVRIVLTRAVAMRDIASVRQAVLGTMALALVALYGATFFLVRHIVRRPIARLEEMVDRIAGGDLDARCPVESGDELGRLAMRVNAMAQRLRESTESLRESERKYRGIVENSPEGIFIVDRDGRIDEANPAMAKLLGYASFADLLDGIPRPAFSAKQAAHLFATLDQEGVIAALELQLQRLDGTPIWVQLNARGALREGFRAQRMEGLLTDVTARKEAVESLRSHRDQLEQEVSERKRTERDLLASREQLRELTAHLEAVREEERKHIAMAIHDELGQLLTAVKMDVSLLKLTLPPGTPGRPKADQIGELVDRTIQIVRNVASHLRPAALNYGLASALEWLAEDFGRHSPIACRFEMRGAEPLLSETRATAIFRIAQEALTNVARHAGASRVDVTLNNLETDLELIVSDDGRGFDVGAARQGYSYGLLGMTERARMADAELQIESRKNAGSVIRVLIRNGQPVLPG